MKPYSIRFFDQPANSSLISAFVGETEKGINVTNTEMVEVIYTHFTPIDYESYTGLKYILCPCTNINHLEAPDHVKVIYLSEPRKLYEKVNSSSEMVLFSMFKMLKNDISASDELAGKRIGFVGYGRMMQKVVSLLSGYINQNLIEVYYFDLEEPEFYINSKIKRIYNLHDLLKTCDIIIIGVTADESTKDFISFNEFKSMEINKPYFINASRGSVVQETPLMKAIAEGNLRGVVLDVTDGYTSEALEKLAVWSTGKKNVHITPHVFGKGLGSRVATDYLVLSSFREVLKGEPDEKK